MRYTWKNIKKSYKNNKYEISAPRLNDRIKLPGGSYCISDIQDYFEYIIKKHGEKADNRLIRMYVCKIEYRIKFKIKKGYYLQLLAP